MGADLILSDNGATFLEAVAMMELDGLAALRDDGQVGLTPVGVDWANERGAGAGDGLGVGTDDDTLFKNLLVVMRLYLKEQKHEKEEMVTKLRGLAAAKRREVRDVERQLKRGRRG